MPEDKARYGTFDILADGAELAIRAILDESRAAPKVAKPGKSATSTRASSTKSESTRAASDRSSIGSRRSKPSPQSTNC